MTQILNVLVCEYRGAIGALPDGRRRGAVIEDRDRRFVRRRS